MKTVEMPSGILRLRLPLEEVLERYRVEYKTFEGAVIDLETDEKEFLEDLCGAYRYRDHSAVCCGILDEKQIEIIVKTWKTLDERFIQTVEEQIRRIKPPCYAFNAGFDTAVLSKLLRREVRFDRELQRIEYENKQLATQLLGIPDFDDPFSGEGRRAAKEWTKHLETHDIDCVRNIIDHNLACVLKEYLILVRQGYREIEPSSYQAFFKGKGDLSFGNCARLPQ